MSTALLLALWFGGLAMATWRTASEWNKPDLARDDEFRAVALGRGARLGAGLFRAIVPMLAAGWAAGLTLSVARLLRAAEGDMVAPYAADHPVVRFITWGQWFMAGCVLIVASIVCFNRPRFLVPPPLRSERGLLWRQ